MDFNGVVNLPLVGDRVPRVLGRLTIDREYILTDCGVFFQTGKGWGRLRYPVTIGEININYEDTLVISMKR